MTTELLTLGLSATRRKKLPASAFPERADEYFCDDCGRDVTKHLHFPHSHAMAPIGAERYECQCGKKWLTGACEWIHFGNREQGGMISGAFVVGMIFSIFTLPFGLGVYFMTRPSGVGLFAAIVVGIFPLIYWELLLWQSVIKSLWRTRFGRSLMVGRE
jgi:hypothetical protein